MSGFQLTLSIVAFLVWSAIVVTIAMYGGDDLMEGRRARGIAVLLCASVVFAVPMGYLLADSSDPNAGLLCRHGHEVWVHRDRPMVLVGKIIVPGGAYTVKTWVCDEWEHER